MILFFGTSLVFEHLHILFDIKKSWYSNVLFVVLLTRNKRTYLIISKNLQWNIILHTNFSLGGIELDKLVLKKSALRNLKLPIKLSSGKGDIF